MKIHYEPFSEEAQRDPYPIYASLREHAPAYFAEEAGAWCVSRHDDVMSVLRRPEVFSSDAMRTMLMGLNPGTDVAADPAVAQRMIGLAQALPFSMEDLMFARSLIAEDPPRHGDMRALVNRGFTPRRIAAWEPRAREVVGECLARLRGAERFDLADDLAIPLPVQLIAEILGVEPERRADFKRWSDVMVAGVSGSGHGVDPVESGLARAMGELAHYVQGVVAEREKQPGDDLISVLVAARDTEERLTPAELTFFVLLLLAAGNETTTNLICNGTLALLGHPAELEKLRADRSLLTGAIEEMLRWDSPVQLVFRRATCEVELAGVTIPKDAGVIALLGSANHDERKWGKTAGEFRVDRNPQGHVAFGFGNHFCLGASLARLEARVAFEELLDELPGLTVGEGVEFVDSFLVRGRRHLPLERAA